MTSEHMLNAVDKSIAYMLYAIDNSRGYVLYSVHNTSHGILSSVHDIISNTCHTINNISVMVPSWMVPVVVLAVFLVVVPVSSIMIIAYISVVRNTFIDNLFRKRYIILWIVVIVVVLPVHRWIMMNT